MEVYGQQVSIIYSVLFILDEIYYIENRKRNLRKLFTLFWVQATAGRKIDDK